MVQLHRILTCYILFLALLCFGRADKVKNCKRCAKDFEHSGGCQHLKTGDGAAVDRLVKPECGACSVNVFKKCGIWEQVSEEQRMHADHMWEQAAFVARGPEPLSECSADSGGTCPAALENLLDVVNIGCSSGSISPEILLGPLKANFEATYWQRRPVLLRRRAASGGICNGTFDEIFDADFATLFPSVFQEAEQRGDIRLMSFSTGDEFAKIDHLYSNLFIGYLDGNSLVFDSFDTHWPDAAHFCQRLSDALPSVFIHGFPPKMNMYITPPGEKQVFGLHNDAQDVLVFQLSGKKSWRVQYERVSRYKGIGKLGQDQRDKPSLQAVLEPGDILYVPRLHNHEAYTDKDTHSTSISLTIPHRHSKLDRHQAAESNKKQRSLLESFPMPTGKRDGPYKMTSQIKLRDRCANCDKAALTKDIASTIEKSTPREAIDRSRSPRVLRGLAAALIIARGNNTAPAWTDLHAPSTYEHGADKFWKLAVGIALNWLGYASLQ